MLKLKVLLSISITSLLLVACNNMYGNDTKMKMYKTDAQHNISDHASSVARDTANAASAELSATAAARP